MAAQKLRKMHIEVCKQFETKFGAEHGDVTSSKFNLAALRAKMGNLEESETMYKQVLTLQLFLCIARSPERWMGR